MGIGRPDHKPTGTGQFCQRCGVAARIHRARNPVIPSRSREYVSARNRAHPRPNASKRIIGIDGEGMGRDPHNYFYLAASDEYGKIWSVGDTKRLSTEDCLDFILDLPTRTLIFGYAFLYDLTKILQDLPNRTLGRLFHEEYRQHIHTDKNGNKSLRPRPERWGRFSLNFMNRRFTVKDYKTGRSQTVWDIFRFFQGKFTQSLIDWEVADREKLTRMEDMKANRDTWNKYTREEIEFYCNEECAYLATLGRKLIDVHEDCGLHLKNFFGAGSTATALLTRMDVNRYRADPPEAMKDPISRSFFGGRFENNVEGPVTGTVYNYDISSAYPYQATLLPCLVCGRWEHTKSQVKIENSTLALVSWTIATIHPSAWGTLPVRAKDGTIAFPLSAVGGWTWKREFQQAQRFNPAVEMREAWIYQTDCDHKPFSELPSIYRERVRIGKDARGIPLKLGPNSVYGKVAQSRGGLNPPFQCWIWAANITSGCRSQLLEGLNGAKNPWDVLMFATDGIWSKERLEFDQPVDTGTFDCVNKDGVSVPLGGWETKTFTSGVFAVRPGIYFPLSPTEKQLKEVRARGLGKKVLYEQWRNIVEAYDAGARKLEITGIERFIGAKSALSYSPKRQIWTRSKFYGEWVEHPVKVSFSPIPKRQAVLKDRRLAPWDRLEESVPYKHATMSPDAILLKLASLIAEEQPNADFADLDLENDE